MSREKSGEITLKLFYDSNLVFTSTKKWLYPLFDLEEFLAEFLREDISKVDKLSLEDKIVGKASAFLIIYLGIKKVHAHILSSHGKRVFDTYNVDYTHEKLIEKIACKTEDLLLDVTQPKEAYRIIYNLKQN